MNSFILRYTSLERPSHWFRYIPRRKKPVQLAAYWPFSKLELWQEHKDSCILRFVVQWKEPKVFHELELPDKAIKAFTQDLLTNERKLINKIMNLDTSPDIEVEHDNTKL